MATESLAQQVSQWDILEQKLWRHIAVLAAFVGAFTIGLPAALEVWREPSNLFVVLPGVWSPIVVPVMVRVASLFMLSYIAMLASALCGMCCLAWAMKWEVLHVDNMAEGFFDRYAEKEYGRLLVAFAKGAVDSYWKNRPAFARKERWSRAGFVFLAATVVAIVLALIFYLVLELRMNPREGL